MSPAHSNFALPAGITEADLVDLVDGCLPSDREAVVMAAVSAEPRLRALVREMRGDRAALGECAAATAPAGMAEEIEARLQSDALRGLASASEEALAPIPISSVRVQRPGVLEGAWTRRLAMAASIAIVGGGAAWGTYSIMHRSSPATTPVEVVDGTPLHTEPPAVVAPEPAPSDLAVVDNTLAVSVGPAPSIAIAEQAPAMTEARASALAREGRLVITIHSVAAQATVKKLDTLAKAGAREGWRTIAIDSVPAEYAALMTPSPSIALPGKPRPSDPAFASEKPVASPVRSQQAPPAVRPIVKAIYTADVNPGDRWLSGLIRTVTDALPEGAVLELREGGSIAPGAAALDPDSVLWWNAPPAKWARKTTVPIVVEGLE